MDENTIKMFKALNKFSTNEFCTNSARQDADVNDYIDMLLHMFNDAIIKMQDGYDAHLQDACFALDKLEELKELEEKGLEGLGELGGDLKLAKEKFIKIQSIRKYFEEMLTKLEAAREATYAMLTNTK